MKKLLITAAALLVTLSIHAQGIVDFGNTTSSLLKNDFKAGSPNVVAADGILVGLYWAPLSDPNNFTLLTPTGTAGVPLGGRFLLGNRTTGNATAPGAQARFQVKAWEAAYGSSYEVAVAAAPMGGRIALRGVSNVIQVGTGDGAQLPPGSLTGLQSFAVNVPEPTTIALGLIGAGALLMLRRRK